VGLGGRGTNHLNIYTNLSESQVVGLCDVNQAAREKAQATIARKGLEKAREFEDMRQMFADPKVEAVSIATPNHWHALSAIWAMKAGKDVYGEKPACYNIYEGMRMIQVQRDGAAAGSDRQALYGQGAVLQAASLYRPHARYSHAGGHQLGFVPGTGSDAPL
jgi:predicted dehydrogenase